MGREGGDAVVLFITGICGCQGSSLATATCRAFLRCFAPSRRPPKNRLDRPSIMGTKTDRDCHVKFRASGKRHRAHRQLMTTKSGMLRGMAGIEYLVVYDKFHSHTPRSWPDEGIVQDSRGLQRMTTVLWCGRYRKRYIAAGAEGGGQGCGRRYVEVKECLRMMMLSS